MTNKLTPTQIAAIRTVAPLLWAGLVTLALERGIDLTARLTDWTNLPATVIDVFAPLVIGVIIWAVAVLTSWDFVERILLFIGIDEYRYVTDGQMVTDDGRISTLDVVVAAPGPEGDEVFTRAAVDSILARGLSADQLRAASQALLDAAA